MSGDKELPGDSPGATPALDRPPAEAHLRFQAEAGHLRAMDLAGRFQYIHDTNLWHGEESRSGLGSDSGETARLREAIPKLLGDLGADALLDVPCGDFKWMSQTDIAGVSYTGGDIVAGIVDSNQSCFGGERRSFVLLDLTRDPLPAADVVLCRDCLVHLSYRNIFAALENIRRSGSTYLLTTTFLEGPENHDIEDGDWRMLNLQRAPFAFPEPLAVILEGCQEGGGAYADKALGLWRVADLPPVP